MILPICCLALIGFALSWAGTLVVRRVAIRIGFVDRPGHRKIHASPKALGGGVAIFGGLGLPLVAAILVAQFAPGMIAKYAGAYALDVHRGIQEAFGLLAAMLAMHVLGLVDDRRALGPYVKLAAQLAIITGLVVGLDLRALTVLDHWLGCGKWPSVVISVLWIGTITNAFNFLDNMDGLSAGVAAVCTVAFLAMAMSIGQWFVSGIAALFLGSLVGFLCFNFPPATIFMGDSGSLLIGLTLGVLTVRTTYLPASRQGDFAGGWYAVLEPAVVLALPLYDFLVVSAIRLARGKSPFVGDTNHFSHRLVARGMSRRTAVLCIYLVTAGTSVAAILLPHVEPRYAPLILAQTLLVLGVVALLEQHPIHAEGEKIGGRGGEEPAAGAAAPRDQN